METLKFFDENSYVTVGEALSDLPDLDAGEGTDGEVEYRTGPQNAYQRDIRKDSIGVSNHIAMKHTGRLIQRFKIIPPGKSLKDVPLDHGQVAKLTGATVSNPYKYNNYRLDPTKPSLAIPASFQSLFLHPEKNRNLTAREAARLMGFPDSFVFQGKRTTMSWEKHLSQYNQIGNAVCPPVAFELAKAMEKALAMPSRSLRNRRMPNIVPTLRSSVAKLPTVRRLEETSDARGMLRDYGASLAQGRLRVLDGIIGHNNLSVATELLPAAIIFARAENCPVCSKHLPPHAEHGGSMPCLISKDDISTLISNENDHGLDYHLRVAFGVEHQIGHAVGELLSMLDLVELRLSENVRTGRKVRSLALKANVQIPNNLATAFFAALQEQQPLPDIQEAS